MPITAKELAQKLGLSETAVSMALNNKPGVSTKTRQEVIRLAEACGYDFTRIKKNSKNTGSIYVISYKAHNAILSYAPIFDELFEGIKIECQRDNYKVKIIGKTNYIYKTTVDFTEGQSGSPLFMTGSDGNTYVCGIMSHDFGIGNLEFHISATKFNTFVFHYLNSYVASNIQWPTC